MRFLPGEVLCQSNRPIVLMLYSNDATDMDTLISFTVCQTCLTQLTWLFLIKCNLRLTVCIHCSPQSEVNLNIYAVGGLTLFHPHLSSFFVCLILCNNSSLLFYCFILLHTHSGFASSFMSLLFLYVLSHMRLSCINKYYLLTYLQCRR